MLDSLVPYVPVAVGFLAMGILHLAQSLVVDVSAIRAGHVPGTPVEGGHDDFLFRATRAHANTNENFGVFIVLSLAAISLAANPRWTNILAWVFVASRAAHMLAYYGNLRLLRSGSFAIGFAALVGLAIVSTLACL